MKQTFYFTFFIFLVSCQPEKRYEGKAIFRYNVDAAITSLDPAFSRSIDNVSAVNHLFNGLVQSNENLLIKPAIAKSWEILDSGKVYRFRLRNDVYYHRNAIFGKDSSRIVVAQDFVYSFNRLVDEKVLSPGKWVMSEVARKEDGTLDISAINDSTLEIRLKKVFPPFLGILSMQYCTVVPKEAIEAYGDGFRSNPVGTGPFKFQFWKENNKLILLKNHNYFEKDKAGNRLPYLDAIAITFIKDQEVAFLKFLKQELDYLTGLNGSYKDEILDSHGKLRGKYKDRVTFTTAPYLNTEYLGFLLDEDLQDAFNPVLKLEIRKAINYGFDRQKMLTYLRNGIGTAAEKGFVPQGLPSFTEELKGYSYQPDSVRNLLAKAGFPNGKGLPVIALSTTAQYLDLCEYLQSQLATFGMNIKIEVNQPATSNELIANAKAEFFRKSWVADYPDAENYLSLFKTENFAPNGPNYTHYSNAEYDKLYVKAMAETNDSLRFLLYQQMDSLVIADAPIVPLFYDQLVRFTHPFISDLGLNPMNLLVLKYAKKKNT